MLGVTTIVVIGISNMVNCLPVLIILAPLCYICYDAAIRSTVMLMWLVVVINKPLAVLPTALVIVKDGSIECLLAAMRKRSIMPDSTKDLLEKMLVQILLRVLL
jgi:hypothetical protein